jgi:hypothetical protein
MAEWLKVPTSSGETLIKYDSVCAITIVGESCDIHMNSGTIFTTSYKNIESIFSELAEIMIS